MKLLIRLFITLAALFSSTLYAGSIYTGVSVMRSTIDVAGIMFNPVVPKVKLGYIFIPKVMFELQFSGTGDENNNNSTMKINAIQAAYLRLASNPDRDFRVHALLGYAKTSLDVTGTNNLTDSYSGFSWAVVFENRLWSSSNYLSLEYNSFYYNDNVEITALSLGLKHTF